MTETTEATAEQLLLMDAVAGALERAGDDSEAQWGALESLGVTLLPIPVELGGAGADLWSTAAVLRALGYAGVSVPIVETALLAGWLLAGSRQAVPDGMLTAAVATDGVVNETASGWRFSGTLPRVPWGSRSRSVVVLVPESNRVLLLDPDDAEARPGSNVAAEPRDDLEFVDAPVQQSFPAPDDASARMFAVRGALGRALLMSGAAQRACELSVVHARDRVQFGRPLAAFQAVQQQLAVQAAEVNAVRVATQAAVCALEFDTATAEVAVAAAKTRAGEAAGTVARIAHQVHGAIGFTDEHPLHRTTMRLWAWRDEYGDENRWALRLARIATDRGGAQLWPLLTSTP